MWLWPLTARPKAEHLLRVAGVLYNLTIAKSEVIHGIAVEVSHQPDG